MSNFIVCRTILWILIIRQNYSLLRNSLLADYTHVFCRLIFRFRRLPEVAIMPISQRMSGTFEKPEKYFKASRVRLAAKRFPLSLFCTLPSDVSLEKNKSRF